jgi:ribosomal protein L11 methyltransferase
VRSYPALWVAGARPDEIDRILAVADDFSPTGTDEWNAGFRIFFAGIRDRDEGRAAIIAAFPHVQSDPVQVDDGDWARRSQQDLGAIRVGRIVVAPPWVRPPSDPGAGETSRNSMVITIEPSMGFGTGHHATTRLCLEALQRLDLAHASILDIGTGSGVLALAASRLGAERALGIDCDADAIRCARENLLRNREVRHTLFEVADLSVDALGPADVVTANLTAALLVRTAASVMNSVRPGGTVILSGLQTTDRDEVMAAFQGATLVDERTEDGWVGLTLVRRTDRADG